jgi:uncharacterized protein with PQ loop repeat
MLNLNPPSSISSTSPYEDQIPISNLPKAWIGFIFAIAFFIAEVIEVVRGNEELTDVAPHFLLISLTGMAYWLFCVYRIHKVLREMDSLYPISPGAAAFFHFIPLYNLIWPFRWASTLTEFINNRGHVHMAAGGLLGLGLLISMLTARFLDASVGLAGMFAIITYISAKLRRHIEAIKGINPESIPPLPDNQFFKPDESIAKDQSLTKEPGLKLNT